MLVPKDDRQGRNQTFRKRVIRDPLHFWLLKKGGKIW